MMKRKKINLNWIYTTFCRIQPLIWGYTRQNVANTNISGINIKGEKFEYSMETATY